MAVRYGFWHNAMSHSPARIESKIFELPKGLVQFIHDLVGNDTMTNSLSEAFRDGVIWLANKLKKEGKSPLQFLELDKLLKEFEPQGITEECVTMTSTNTVLMLIVASTYSMRSNDIMIYCLAQYLTEVVY